MFATKSIKICFLLLALNLLLTRLSTVEAVVKSRMEETRGKKPTDDPVLMTKAIKMQMEIYCRKQMSDTGICPKDNCKFDKKSGKCLPRYEDMKDILLF